MNGVASVRGKRSSRSDRWNRGRHRRRCELGPTSDTVPGELYERQDGQDERDGQDHRRNGELTERGTAARDVGVSRAAVRKAVAVILPILGTLSKAVQPPARSRPSLLTRRSLSALIGGGA